VLAPIRSVQMFGPPHPNPATQVEQHELRRLVEARSVHDDGGGEGVAVPWWHSLWRSLLIQLLGLVLAWTFTKLAMPFVANELPVDLAAEALTTSSDSEAPVAG